jgi:uncharacterized protein DUF5615
LARLYADENFPLPAVEALRRLGHDVLTAAEAGQAGQGIADDAVLAFAHSLGRDPICLENSLVCWKPRRRAVS